MFIVAPTPIVIVCHFAIWDGPLMFKQVLMGGLTLAAMPAGAVTLGDALAADRLVAAVEAMDPSSRADFIQSHRSQLNQALQTKQTVGAVAASVQTALVAAERIYRRPLLCSGKPVSGTDDEILEGTIAPAPLPDLARMAAEFKSQLRQTLALPDTPAIDAKTRSDRHRRNDRQPVDH